MNVAIHPAYSQAFTIDDLYALPDDGTRHELVDGTLLMSPPPTVGHQRVTTRLTLLLGAAVSSEFEVLESPGVRLGAARVLQPDVIVASRAVLDAAMRDVPAAAVPLAVEVMSPSSVTNDRVTKPSLYAEAGIATYLRFEMAGPDAPLIYHYRLEGTFYRELARVPAGQSLQLGEPVRVSIDPGALLEP
jgi:Uma2 family endonuclease